MQTLTRVEPCSCETGAWRGQCSHVSVCRRNAAVEAEAREWDSLLDEYKERNAMLGAEVERLKAEEWARKVAALEAVAEMLAAVVQGAREEYVRVPYGASHEDVEQINDWHRMAAEALAELEALK